MGIEREKDVRDAAEQETRKTRFVVPVIYASRERE
jgi:hypothetical protein